MPVATGARAANLLSELCLVPQPRTCSAGRGSFTWPIPPSARSERGGAVWLVLDDSPVTADLFGFQRFASEASALTGSPVTIARESAADATANAVPPAHIRCLHDASVEHSQGYTLEIALEQITLRASTAAGMFYALQTLTQIVRARTLATIGPRSTRLKSLTLPALTITDYPGFDRRGVYHDISRGKVPTLSTLLQLVDDLASLKINEFQLYIENVFEFRRHAAMYKDTTPLTPHEILLIDYACRQRHIDFVPSLTSLGHFEKILSKPEYRHLAEAEPEQLRAIGAEVWVNLPWSLCVTDPRAKQLLKEMYGEFLPNFSSPTFNICCDESYDLAKVRSADELAAKGPGQVYADWINYCNGLAKAHGRTIQMWGDIIRKYPDKISQLPEDATLLEWGYESAHNFLEKSKVFVDTGKRFYVCPGTSSWNTLSSRTKNAFGNIHDAAVAGMKYGAAGLLNTDWGDAGHQQLHAMSLLAFAYGAAASWNHAAETNPDPLPDAALSLTARPIEAFLDAVDAQVFVSRKSAFARDAYELGLVYEKLGWQRSNASGDFLLFREAFAQANVVNRFTPANLKKVDALARRLAARFEKADLLHADGDLIRAEFVYTAELISHVMRRTLARQQWLAVNPLARNPEHEELRAKKPVPLKKAEFKKTLRALKAQAHDLGERFESLWLARNKQSRLVDVMDHFTRLEQEYDKYGR